MSSTLNKDFYIARENLDVQASYMSVNCTGDFVLFAGRYYIAICNLDKEAIAENVQKFPRLGKYDVSAAEWNPTNHNQELCAISSNQRLEVLTFRPSELIQCCGVRAHTRPITCLNWHPFDPWMVASTALDTLVHLWDVRDPRRPTNSFVSISEANQVCWNRLNSHILATTHDGDVKVWDRRKGTAPMHYIAAHLAQINHIEWSPRMENQLVTGSHDTVKVFDVAGDNKKPNYVINTNSSVWKVKFTPVGRGIVTVLVPLGGRGNHNSLILWQLDNLKRHSHTFVGHRDAVLDLGWRKGEGSKTDYHMVTWSRDQSLVIWKMEHLLGKLMCQEHKSPFSERIAKNVTNSIMGMADKNNRESQTLAHELAAIDSKNIHSDLKIVNLDATNRTCEVEANVDESLVELRMVFPEQYPHKVAPTFTIVSSKNLPQNIQTRLLQMLSNFAALHVSKERLCLEACLKEIIPTLEKLTGVKNDFEDKLSSSVLFPRTCRAKFCSVGVLVCFTGAKGQKTKGHKAKGLVNVYNVSYLMLVNRPLAEEYILDGDVSTICRHNAASAAVLGRWDLVQAWSLAEYVVSTANEDGSWSRHPLGDKLAEALIHFYATRSDIQMAAMLSCVFSKKQLSVLGRPTSIKEWPDCGTLSSLYHHSLSPTEVLSDDWVIPGIKTQSPQSLENVRGTAAQESKLVNANRDPKRQCLLDYYKRSYAEILHRWKLIYQRTEVLKCLSTSSELHQGVEFVTECGKCGKCERTVQCRSCREMTLTCVICHLPVRGAASCCVVCGHGGHSGHLQGWFELREQCPAGCGCRCLQENGHIFECY